VAGAGEAKRRCDEQSAADATAVGKSQAGLPTPGTNACGGVLTNAALQEQLQSVLARRDRMGLMAATVARSGKRKVSRPFFLSDSEI